MRLLDSNHGIIVKASLKSVSLVYLFMIDLARMTSPEIKEAIQEGYSTVVFSVGSNEQHGPCLAVSTDTILGDALSQSVASKLGDALKAPTVNLGCSEHHMRFPGTITLTKETLQSIVREYVDSLKMHGFKRIIVLPSHGGNFNPLKEIAGELKEAHPDIEITVYHDLQGFVKIMSETSQSLGVSPEESGAHAGESEVSMMMYIDDDLVRGDCIDEAQGYMGGFNDETASRIFEEGIGALSSIGVLGDPRKASEEHGELYIENLTKMLVEYIKSTP
jgi:creatinine amidohydrolase